jgi:hypothetical protein
MVKWKDGRSLEQKSAVEAQTRFVGLDVHRRYATVAAVDSQQQVVLTVRRIDFQDFDVWIRKNLRKTDVVTLEATSNAWHLYDKLYAVRILRDGGQPDASRADRQDAGED